MSIRTYELSTLVAVLAIATMLGGHTHGAQAPMSLEARVQRETYTLDGIGPGMSYRQVVQISGKPEKLGWQHELTYFVYPAESEDRKVWFSAGQVVYCEGTVLRERGEVIYDTSMPVEVLVDKLGRHGPFWLFQEWFPDSGVVLFADPSGQPEQEDEIGLRSLAYPFERNREEPSFFTSEHWLEFGFPSVEVGGIELGSRADAIAGNPSIQVDGGYVRGFRVVERVELLAPIGAHRYRLVGQVGRRTNLPVDETHSDGWYGDSVLSFREQGGITKEIRVEVKDEELFAALRGD